jgi:hypothetical protein
VTAAIASPARCCQSLERSAMCVAAQSAMRTMQMAKKAGELVKFDAASAV